MMKTSKDTTKITTTITTTTTTETMEVQQDQPQTRALRDALDAGKHTFVVEYGGQAIAYWAELTQLYNDHGDAVRAFLDAAADALREESSSPAATASPAFEQTIDLKAWLATSADKTTTTSAPPKDKHSRAFYSYALIALTQAANYIAFLHQNGLRHEDVVKHTSAAIGHSQGVVSAAVFSAAKTQEEFEQLSVLALRYMFWHGLRAQEAFIQLCAQHDEDVSATEATPMLVVGGLTKAQVLKAVEVTQRKTQRQDVQLSLINGKAGYVVTGLPSTLELVKQALTGMMAKPDENQNRVPHSSRKPSGSLTYLSVSCAFHSSVLAPAKTNIAADVERIGLSILGKDLQVPVYSTSTEGANLQVRGDANILSELIDLQLTEVADWTATQQKIASNHHDATHVLDFGPDFGASKLTASTAEGLGLTVVAASVKHSALTPLAVASPIHGLDQLVSGDAPARASWDAAYGPRTCPKTGKLVNNYTRLLKKAPVMVAGMTPTTSLGGIDLVAAIQNAGFHGELAAGGLSRPNIFESSIRELVSKIKPGLGISINMLYLNAKQWGFQFPMVIRLRKSGVPIESITIGAGILTKDRAVEIISELQGAGINLLGLKPGSIDGINAVLEIARAAPTMNIMLQWTGGRAGGHHSFEDFHQPLEATYAAIRRVPNVLLVVGSGFGNWEDSHAYVTGEWSLSRGHTAKMPADGILLGSRVMVAKEAATATEVKQLLVDTPGTASELEWEQSYSGIAGGVVTVTSELGEPIHKVANRCSILWREFDQKYFAKPRDEMELAVRLDRDAIIERLNSDFQKPYFGCKITESGERVPAELEEMTYSEVLMRMIELMFVDIPGRPQRWLHESFLDRVVKFMARTEERFRRDTSGASFDSSLLSTQPRETLKQFITKFPKSVTTVLSVPDCDFFLELCRSGDKPVTFIPIIDKEFKTWYKKDSLWYSEDLDAVPNRDAQRVCILQGPVAVRYSTVCDEPVGKILGDIAEGFRQVVAAQPVTASNVSIATVEQKVLPDVAVEATAEGQVLTLPESSGALPASADWHALLASSASEEWQSALLSSKFVGQGRKWVPNPVLALLSPQVGQTVKLTNTGIEVFDASIVGLDNKPVVHIAKNGDVIVVEVAEVRPATADLEAAVVPLQLKFSYNADTVCTIHEDDSDLIDRIKHFYARFWAAEQGKEEESCKAACEKSVLGTFTDEIVVSKADAAAYNAALGLSGGDAAVPADFSTIACWKALIASVFTKEVKGNLLDLVHLKHSYKLLSKEKKNFLFQAGDELVSESKVSSLRIIESGKVVSGVAKNSRRAVNGLEEVLQPVVELRSEFLIRGKFVDFETTFAIENDSSVLDLTHADNVAMLKTKSWFVPVSGVALPALGDQLEFVSKSEKTFKSLTVLATLDVTGEVYKIDPASRTKIADLKFSGAGVATSPISAFIEASLRGKTKETVLADSGYTMLEKPLEIEVPANALAYAVASRDLNPIHRSSYAALLANLPHGKPIMHGMWSATKVRALTVKEFGGAVDSNVVQYDASFEGMVYPGDKLYVQACHTGMNDGCKILSIEVVNQAGERVISARAQVKEPVMAFVFTGQGSAEVGMGMDRYKESPIARDVWDRGDKHLRETFGFSILEIVRKNPSAITVHFGGKRGRAIRENYMKLTCEDVETGELAPLLPEINSRTQSFAFSASEGLLLSTQFSQPALVLLEKAMFSEIQASNLIPDDALFAGHSLGEYAGLSSFAGALAVEDVAEVVFLRGLIMQKAVKRDSQGRSDYGMVAANPARVGPHFTEAVMHKVVEGICAASGKLLQVVNYNVEGLQYVVAGENVNLEALSISLSAIKASKQFDLSAIVADALAQAQAKKDKAVESGKPFVVARGSATIPLVGIDVPFHSRELLGGVPAFRSLLRTKFEAHVLEKQLPLLVGRYIPNLVAVPFSMEKSYVEKVYEATKSPFLAEVLDPMQWQLTTAAQLAHLLMVELLAYQFASPVQWIKTQSHLFTLNGTGVRRFVEIGPAATLTNMAQRTLQFGKFPKVSRDILWYQRDRDVVHFEIESEFPSASEYPRTVNAKVEEVVAEPESSEPAPAALAPPPAQVHIPAPIVQASAAPVADAPVSAIHVLRVLLAIRLNKELPEVSVDTDVKTLSAGKSAVQNEIIGDLEKEFGSGIPDGAGEMPLKELAAKFGSYSTLGKVTNGLINKMIAGKMPGGFTMTSVKTYLTSKGLGAGRLESVLVHSLLRAPQARLKSEAEAKQWLDSTTDDYAAFAGVTLARPAAASGFAGGMPQFAPAAVSVPTVADKPVDAKHALLVLLSSKMNKSFSEVSPDTTIKELAAGKSAVQNEIVGDLEKEFGSGPDDAAESKLADLAAKFPSYASPGKVTSALIAKLLAGKMPGGFGLSAIKAYLSSERCLPAGRIESVLLHTLTQNPKQRFTDEGQAKAWLDSVVDDYAKFAGIDIPYLSKLGGGGGGGAMAAQSMGVAALPTDFDKRLKEMIADQVDALNEYLGTDKLEANRRVETEVELREQVEGQMSVFVEEHGEFYANGINGLFNADKERQYDSFWNWATQDAMVLYYRTIFAAASQAGPANSLKGGLDEHFQAMSRWINEKVDDLNQDAARPPLEWFKLLLCNRATPELLQATQFFVQKVEAEACPEYAEAVQLLVEQIEMWIKRNPVNVQIFEPVRPHLEILESGEMKYSEIPREGVSDSIDYVDELARGLEYRFADDAAFSETADETNITMESAVGFESTMKQHEEGEDSSPEESDEEEEPEVKPRAASIEVTKAQFEEPAQGPKLNALRASLKKRMTATKPSTLIERSSSLRVGLNENLKQIVLPHVHVRKPSDVDPTIRLYDVEMTCKLLASMREMATAGVSFSEKVALITGCGRNSIGAEVVKALLEGGATVFVTTSSFGSKTAALFRSIYEHHGSRGSRLILLPFNQASKSDVRKLVSHIYDVHKLDLDFVVPFAALSEVGRTIADIDSRSELAHRIMLTNTMRLLGEIVSAKKSRDISTRPALAILPLSPNHGNFGGDGLYAESKLGVESLMNKWHSEGCEDQISVVGAVIGWTRGTGLMSGNNVVAEGVEKLGVRTFSTKEMGFNLAALMHPTIVDMASEAPLWADLTGGMAQLKDLKNQVDSIRQAIMADAKLKASVFASRQSEVERGAAAASGFKPRANLSGYYCNNFPSMAGVPHLSHEKSQVQLRDMINLRNTVVVAGFGEVSPWGNARTRWEMESYGEFSIEGCMELAWLTGRIVYDNGNWVDAKTKEVVPDSEIKSRYEEELLRHSGIRIIEPELFEGYDPKHKTILHQVAIDKKMAPIEVADHEEALQFRSELGKENVDIFQNASGAWMIRLRKGAVLSIPRALSFDRFVAGQIPTGWSAERLGLSKDIAESVDPVTLFTLASTMDAFVAAGVTDPYEFYQYVHVSEVGNTSGGGSGGIRSFKRIYQDRLFGKTVASDTLQECFINTAPAWVNMLLLSSSGPIKTPVGACATAAESVDIGVDTIRTGKARVVIVGGNDDFGEEGSYEFAQMKATSDSVKETRMGREPREMCRPCSTTRGGFMESHGAGMQLLMDAQLALEMGCPIYGIVALTSTATDKNGRSVPAPGQGILTTAREADGAASSPLLDIEYRRRQFDTEMEGIEAWYAREKSFVDEQNESQVTFLEDMKRRKVQAAQAMWGDEFFTSRTDIAPIRGALSVWNLTIDDIGVASFHGTGTVVNDKNESEVTQKQLQHLGRSKGNVLPVVCQKNITGHPKGAAAAWMLNGLLQVLNSGLIPGNRNLDNTCSTLRKFDYLMYPNRSIQTDGIKAAIMKSFGFGQAGGEILLVHPDYLLSLLPEEEFQLYSQRRQKRLTSMNAYVQKSISGKQKYIQVKDSAPYTSAQESSVYLDPTARAEYDPVVKTWHFGPNTDPAKKFKAQKRAKKSKAPTPESTEAVAEIVRNNSSTLLSAMSEGASATGLAAKNFGIGVEVEPVMTFENLHGREDFIRRNFTDQEMAYCYSAPHPAASFAGRWAAKEAVIKAISSAAPSESNMWKGAGAPLREIEIFMTASGAPSVLLSGYPQQVFNRVGLGSLSVSISHSGDYAVAQAVASFTA